MAGIYWFKEGEIKRSSAESEIFESNVDKRGICKNLFPPPKCFFSTLFDFLANNFHIWISSFGSAQGKDFGLRIQNPLPNYPFRSCQEQVAIPEPLHRIE